MRPTIKVRWLPRLLIAFGSLDRLGKSALAVEWRLGNVPPPEQNPIPA